MDNSVKLICAELSTVQSISGRNVLKTFPMSKQKRKQKLILGDDGGALHCIQMKKGEPVDVFTTPSMKGSIKCVQIGGYLEDSERAFAASGQSIVGYNKKGKEFFKFESNLSEEIHAMSMDDHKLWTATDYVYNLYVNGEDSQFYMCKEKINAMVVETMVNDLHKDVLLGCQDKTIRLIRDSDVLMEKALSAPVSALAKACREHGAKDVPFVAYGTSKGTLGHLVGKGGKLKTGWKLSADKKGGAVSCIELYDFTRDGAYETLVGREDGRLQIYSSNEDGAQLIFENTQNESIRGMKGAVVNTPGFEELVACTYSGKIVSYTSEPLNEADDMDDWGRSRGAVQRETRIVKLRKEVGKLKERLEMQREKFEKESGGGTPISQAFNVNHSFEYSAETASYCISIEIPAKIDMIVLHSQIRLDLLEQQDETISNISSNPPNSPYAFNATFRSMSDCKRMEIHLRTMEGQFGEIQLMVVARGKPKSASVVKMHVKPLSMHHRVHDIPPENIPKHMNTLTFTGSFPANQMHDWINHCLPDVPAHSQDEETILMYQNPYLGTYLTCTYRQGDATFESNSASTIAILKEVITKEATNRKVAVNMKFDIEQETIRQLLTLLRPKLDEQHGLAVQVELIDAIKEVEMQEEGSHAWMSDEYKYIIENADRIKTDFKAQPRALQYLSGILTDLLVDVSKFRGVDANQQVSILHQLLQNYNFDNLVHFFMHSD